ncbi:hypothetical protein MMC31_001250, partial [Peltigera leucophlebia]|nr:hypothetical protein [Peltigera leucophlebia]
MHIVYLNQYADYAVYPCLEPDYPEDPINNHGPSIEMNQDTVQPGYYVILSPTGQLVEILVTEEVAPVPVISQSSTGQAGSEGPGNPWGVESRRMILADCAPELQPLRGLLKYHFRNSVLCNMKGRGPGYDWDDSITPGRDDVAEISNAEE